MSGPLDQVRRTGATPLISIVVPVYNGEKDIERSLFALLSASAPGAEVIVVDDASSDNSASFATRAGVKLIRLSRNSGAAAARNMGASRAVGEILFFVDADVVVAPDAVKRVLETFRQQPDLAAVFGSYDSEPRAKSLASQYRNLLHHYIHQTGNQEAFTFWAGCGAIRKAAFDAVGGFDEAETWRCIEDIELGYRLRGAGYRILLDKNLQCTHLKRWTIGSMVRTDVRYRAIPWARLILRGSAAPNDLNIRSDQRASVILAGIAAVSVAVSFFLSPFLFLAVASLLAVAFINRRFYRFLARHRGLGFAAACFPLHLLYFFCSGAGFFYVWVGAVVGSRSRLGIARGR